MPNNHATKHKKCLENNPDLLDRLYDKNSNDPALVAKRHRCKQEIKIINDAIKAAVASGDAEKLEAQLVKLEQAVFRLESTYLPRNKG